MTEKELELFWNKLSKQTKEELIVKIGMELSFKIFKKLSSKIILSKEEIELRKRVDKRASGIKNLKIENYIIEEDSE